MLSVSVHKDITEYKPKIIGDLTLRSLISIAAAMAAAVVVGVYFKFVLGLDYDVYMYAILIVVLPIWAIGFWQPLGMPAEKFIPLWLRHTFTDDRIFYVTSIYENGIAQRLEQTPEERKTRERELSREYRKIRKIRGVERFEPARMFDDDLMQCDMEKAEEL